MKKVSVLMPNFAKRGGLVVVVVQDVNSLEILMVAYTNRECFLETLKTGQGVYYSTSRKKMWRKGEESGNAQKVCGVKIDCDADALIYMVKQKGNACHKVKRSCFYRSVIGSALNKKSDEQIEIHVVSDSIV